MNTKTMQGAFSDQFDYIIVGAGSAGCVMANRLSADPHVRVALIEAGPSDRRFPANFKTSMPAGNIFLLPHAKYNWQYKFASHEGVANRELPCPRGRLLGGSSSVNASVYMRGHPSDYDEWAALGNDGWRYQDVLPYFKGHQNYPEGDPRWHGQGGELQVGVPSSVNPMARAFVDAAVAAGFSRNDDPNGGAQDGFGISTVTQRGGLRSSASRAFLHPILHRKNLKVFTNCLVERVQLRDRRATGVLLQQAGRQRELSASTEVVLACGTTNSPQLLLLSGIGPAAHLREKGIRVALDLPGVGENLQDHPSFSVASEDPSRDSYALTLPTLHRAMAAPLQYLFGRGGMLASNAAEAFGYIRSRPDLSKPDLQLCFLVGLKGSSRLLPTQHGSVLMVNLLRPASRGRVTLQSADPRHAPVVQPNFLSRHEDIDTLLHGFRQARRILDATPFSRHRGQEIAPGAAVQSDADVVASMRAQLGSTHHCVGSCKMGPATDPMAVVDARLRVHGIEGLRVADASVMPRIVGGNTNAPVMMIGERAAAFIRTA